MPRVKLEDHANAKQKIKEIKTSLKAMRESDKEYANKQFDLADLYLTYPFILYCITFAHIT